MILDRKQAEYLLEQMDLGKADAEDIAYGDIKSLKAEVLVAREEKEKYQTLEKEIVKLREKAVTGQGSEVVEQLLQECAKLKEKLAQEKDEHQATKEGLEAAGRARDFYYKRWNEKKTEIEENRPLGSKALLEAFLWFVFGVACYVVWRCGGNGFLADCVICGRVCINIVIKFGILCCGGVVGAILLRGYYVLFWGIDILLTWNFDINIFKDAWKDCNARIFSIAGFLGDYFC